MKSVIQYINEKMVHTSSNSMKLDMVALFSYIMGMDYSKSEDDVIMALNDFTHKCVKSIKNIEIATDHIDPHDNGTFVIKTTYPKLELEKIGKTKYKEFEKEIYSDPDDVIEVDFENNHIDQYLMLNYGLNMLIYTSNEGGFILKA